MPVPLHCTWYNLDEQGQFLQINEVTGACYQPSLEDVGKKILVHAIPASDVQEYQGMPLCREIGPILADREVEEKIS